MPEVARGLEGVVVAQSAMSKVFGEEGDLVYRGYSIHDLAAHATFEEVAFLLWNGRLPRRAELQELTQELASMRAVPQPVLEWIRKAPAGDSMAKLRTAVSMLSHYDDQSENLETSAVTQTAKRLTAQMATLTAAIGRAQDGHDTIAPDAQLGHAANFLYMLTGTKPDDIATRTFDQALVLHADHGFNASTFSARVTTSTLSDMYSAIVAAIGTLKGASHGGANQRVMEMLLELDASGKTPEAWVHDALAAGKRIMGFGHRVYKVIDPRAVALRSSSRKLAEVCDDDKWFRLSEEIEKIVDQAKGLKPNVDFFSASTYYMLGIPTHLYTPIFAVSRIVGWSAHVLEQMGNNRLIRPRSEYTGALQANWVDLDQR